MNSIMVTDGGSRTALAVVRSLGRAGNEVHVASTWKRCIAGASRFVHRTHITPDPTRDARGFVESLRDALNLTGSKLVVPVTEVSTLAILQHRDVIPNVKLPFRPERSFHSLNNKSVVLSSAKALGILVPMQWVIGTPNEIQSVKKLDISFPVAIKAHRSVASLSAGVLVKAGTEYAANVDELVAVLSNVPAEAFPMLVQQRIIGRGVGIFLLNWDNRLLAAFSHERLREKPPEGGVSVHCESRALDQDLLAKSLSLIAKHEWEGVAMIEFKQEEKTGSHYLMEVNPRFWGSLQLAIDAGVDFPRLLAEAVLNGSPQPVMQYRVGVRTRWYWGEIDHLLALRHARNRAFASGRSAGSPLKTAFDVALPWRPGSKNEVFRADDPMPFLVESHEWFKGLFQSVMRRI